MVLSKASRGQKVRQGHWLVVTSSDRSNPWRSRFEKDARIESLGVVQFLDARVELYTDFVEGRRAQFNDFFREVKAILNSFWDEEKQEGVPPSAWKVVIAFPHGDAKGGLLCTPTQRTRMLTGVSHLNGGPHSIPWVCDVFISTRAMLGGTLQTPVIKRGPEGANDDVITVTAWDSKIGQYDERGDECAPNDDYLFRGMPLCRAMDKSSSRNGLRGFNSIWELRVSVTGRGAEVRHRVTPKAGR